MLTGLRRYARAESIEEKTPKAAPAAVDLMRLKVVKLKRPQSSGGSAPGDLKETAGLPR
jgi:hypothetical protein